MCTNSDIEQIKPIYDVNSTMQQIYIWKNIHHGAFSDLTLGTHVNRCNFINIKVINSVISDLHIEPFSVIIAYWPHFFLIL